MRQPKTNQEIKEFYEVTKYNLRQNSPIEDFLCK